MFGPYIDTIIICTMTIGYYFYWCMEAQFLLPLVKLALKDGVFQGNQLFNSC